MISFNGVFSKLESYKGVINVSEKLYNAIQAIETFNGPIPKRTLIFINTSEASFPENRIFIGPSERKEVSFPEDRMTLIFNEKLYDWYGREVEFREDIAKVLSYYGYANDSSGHQYETFVTELANGRLAIACLKYEGIDWNKFTEQIYTKHYITGNIILGKPFLDRQSWSFESFYEPPSLPNYLTELNSWFLENFNLEYKICINSHFNYYGNEIIQPILFMPTHLFVNDMDGSLLEHYIFANRDAIFESGRPIRYVRKLFGNLEFSKDGSKMTAFAELANGKRVRISTDTDVIHKACKGPYVCWYLDPKPKS